MSRDCPVDKLVGQLRWDYTPQEQDVHRVLDQVTASYMQVRSKMPEQLDSPKEALAEVLLHAVDHMTEWLGAQLLSMLCGYMQQHGMTTEQFVAAVEAKHLEDYLTSMLQGMNISVHAVLPGKGDKEVLH